MQRASPASLQQWACQVSRRLFFSAALCCATRNKHKRLNCPSFAEAAVLVCIKGTLYQFTMTGSIFNSWLILLSLLKQCLLWLWKSFLKSEKIMTSLWHRQGFVSLDMETTHLEWYITLQTGGVEFEKLACSPDREGLMKRCYWLHYGKCSEQCFWMWTLSSN